MTLGDISQIALPVSSADISEKFYEQVLGLQKLFRFGDLVFFDCGGTRLMLSQDAEVKAGQQAIYFRTSDIAADFGTLKSRGVIFEREPHLVAPMPDHDLWMAFFRDPDAHLFALMHEAPKGYSPQI